MGMSVCMCVLVCKCVYTEINRDVKGFTFFGTEGERRECVCVCVCVCV